MEWQQIIGFCHVARLGSFTQAAAVTFRTQSALSQQIKALEEELGSQLLERIGKRKIKLTAAGERFLEFAQGILARYDQLKEELAELQGRQEGNLTIAAPFTTLYHLFPRPVKAYLRQFPQVALSLLDRSQERVIALVKNGDCDFGLARESLAPQELRTIRWQPVHTVLMTPRGHPLAQLPRVTWGEMARYPLILPPRSHRAHRQLEEHFRQLGVEYHIILESSNVELSSIYVEMGLGVSFSSLVQDLPTVKSRSLEFLPLDHYFPPDHIAVVLRKDKMLAPYKEAFLKILFTPTFDYACL